MVSIAASLLFSLSTYLHLEDGATNAAANPTIKAVSENAQGSRIADKKFMVDTGFALGYTGYQALSNSPGLSAPVNMGYIGTSVFGGKITGVYNFINRQFGMI